MAGTTPRKKKGKDAAALIAGRKPAERTVSLCMRADLRSEMVDLNRELFEAQRARADNGSLSSGTRVRELAEELEALHQQMLDATLDFKVRGMSRRKWRELALAHPARDDVLSDQAWGVNEDTFFQVAIRQCCYEPELPDDTWAQLLDEDEGLTEAEWEALRDAVVAVNRTDVDVPFSRAASRILAADSETN